MKIFEQFDLTEFNSYRIKSSCRIAYFPESEQDVIDFFREHKTFILLGSGHNIIFSKEYYETPILIFNGNYNNVLMPEPNCIEAEAGAMMWDISTLAMENSLSGLEVFFDIPSSLGGAVVMNAGASGEEIKDVLVKVRYLDLDDMQIKEIEKKDMGFEYRGSFFQSNTNKIILKALLRLNPSDKEVVRHKMETVKEQRWAKQPKDFPNAGSVFKRPPGYYVGALTSELGLKGYAVGGAKISEKHGGFIINFNEATGQEILMVIEEAKKRVYEKYGVDLQIEQRII